MAGLLGGGAKAQPAQVVAPPPQVDDATSKLNEQDKVNRRQGRKSTILTSDGGLPDLGSTTTTGS